MSNLSRADVPEARPPSTTAAPAGNRLLIKPKPRANAAELARLHSQNRCEVVRSFPGLGDIQVLRLMSSQAVGEIVARYRTSPLVEFAEPDYRVQLAGVFPNDPSFLDGTLWALNNAGQNGGLPNADIDAPEAWRARTTATNLIVAIVDSGIRYTHEDLAANIWTSPIDGSHGINVLAGTTDPDDDNGHGTLIAGVIGAVGSNGVGIVGVTWRVQLMACKFANRFGFGEVSDALVCLDYARTNGAHIINASWGLDDNSLSLSNAIAALQAAGILVVAAAGNQGRDIDVQPRYPASYNLDNVITVMATTRRDELYPLTNFGATNVDLAAPGYEILSTDISSNSAYAFDEGTSMATAYVSGAAALVRAAYPTDTPAQIIGRLLAAAEPLPMLAGKCASGGRLNLRKALAVPISGPVLNAAVAAPGGSLVLQLSGDPGRTYVVEASTNFWEWQPAFTNLTGFDGSFSVTNIPSADASRQFYRARVTP